MSDSPTFTGRLVYTIGGKQYDDIDAMLAAARLEGIREAAEVVTGLNVPLPPEMGLDESSFTAGTTAFAVAAATTIEALASKEPS